MYAYPQQQYMSPGYSDQASSPAAIGGFGAPATQSRDAMGASLGDYNRMNTSASQQSLPQHFARYVEDLQHLRVPLQGVDVEEHGARDAAGS